MKTCIQYQQEKSLEVFLPSLGRAHKACSEFCPHKKAERVRVENETLQGHYSRKLHLGVIKEYGSKCVCCGAGAPQFPALHYVNGDGKEHRKETKGSGNGTYLWLRRNGYSKEGYALLCHNCNFSAGTSGVCRHALLKQNDNEVYMPSLNTLQPENVKSCVL